MPRPTNPDNLPEPPNWPPLYLDEDTSMFGERPVAALTMEIDPTINQNVAETMRTKQVLTAFPGWNFHATCWFADSLFHAAVCQWTAHVANLSADTPEELRDLVLAQFGGSR